MLYRRIGTGSPYRKILYWKRGEDSNDPPPPKLTSFAIVPEMTTPVTQGYAVYGNTFNNTSTLNVWKAFDRSVLTTGSFGTYNANTNGENKYAWAIVTFPEPRIVRGWTLQFEYTWSQFFLAIEGKLHNGQWTRIFESTSVSPVNYGRFGATATPMQCTAVRILTDCPSAVRSCQLFEAVPLVPVTMQWNSTLANAGAELVTEPVNYNLNRCFTDQNNAFTHGTAAWYYNGGEWQSNKGFVSTKDQNRFIIRFAEPRTVCGFSVGGIGDNNVYYSDYFSNDCYANCLLIEGRESDADFWQPIDELEFSPSEWRSRYFDFPANRTVGQLRITVQDVTHGRGTTENTAVYLPPMQVYGV